MQVLLGCRVLFIEDDEDARFLVTTGLELRGAVVIGVGSGAEALECLETAAPDVLISDLALSDMHGTELLQRVRRYNEFEHVPAIALTGHGGPEQREAALRGGFDKYLVKPTKTVDLISAILGVEKRPRPGHPERTLRTMLAALNAMSPCRYTSLFCFVDDKALASVWTHDRENPGFDAFPLNLPIEASYCALVRSTNDVCVIEDASNDSRTRLHPKRGELATYIGVPRRASDGRNTGTLCCYDAKSLVIDASVRTEVESTTLAFAARLVSLLDIANVATIEGP